MKFILIKFQVLTNLEADEYITIKIAYGFNVSQEKK
jgi:hypothetical protein